MSTSGPPDESAVPGHRETSISAYGLVMLGLTGFAVGQPLLGVLGDNPTVFTNNGIRGWLIVAYALLVAFALPAALWVLVVGIRKIDRRAAHLVFLVLIGILTAGATIQLAKSLHVQNRAILLIVAVACGITFPLGYTRVGVIATWARYTAILPAIAVLAFVFSSESGSLALASNEQHASTTATTIPSVVMIVLDEFPTMSLLNENSQIDNHRFPNLSAFGQDATWFRHYTTLSPFTESAVPSMLSGNFPKVDAATFANYPHTIFSLLAPTHDEVAFETATSLCSEADCHRATSDSLNFDHLLKMSVNILKSRVSLNEDRPVLLDEFAEETAAVGANEAGKGNGLFDLVGGSELAALPVRVDQFVKSLGTGSGPTFRYLHLMLPHSPWLLYSDGTRYAHSDELGVGLPVSDRAFVDRWSPWTSTVTYQRFLLQATYTDSLVGLILRQLRDLGRYDDTLIVVAADHGVSFGPRTPTREITKSTLNEIAYAPLLIKAPHQTTGTIDDSNLMAVDLIPTLAKMLGVVPGWQTDGFPAGSPEILRRGDLKVWYDMRDAFALKLAGTFEYHDSEHFPSQSQQLISLGADVDDPLAGLRSSLNIDNYFGRKLADFNPDSRGSVRLARLGDLRSPPPHAPQVLVATGQLEGVPWAVNGSVFVLAVNGTIVTGSRVSVDSNGTLQIMAFIPPGVLGSANDIRAALVTMLGVVELQVT